MLLCLYKFYRCKVAVVHKVKAVNKIKLTSYINRGKNVKYWIETHIDLPK